MAALPPSYAPRVQAGGQALDTSTKVMGHEMGFLLLAFYPNELKTFTHTKTCTQNFMGAVFIIANQAQPRCPSVSEWINKPKYIQSTGYYLALKGNELSCHEMAGRKLITKWTKPIWKGYIRYDSNYKTSWKRQSYGDSRNVSGFQEPEVRKGRIDGTQRGFLWQWNYYVWISHGGSVSLYICQNP